MKAPDVARRRIRNTRLTGTPFRSADEAVRWHLAMQAQDYAPAKWSIGQRSKKLRDADLDEAVAEGSVVRTHVLRPTWHFVARDDLRWLLALSGPRVQRGNARRYRDLGLDAKTRARCEHMVGRALEGGARLTRDELGAVLESARIDRAGQRMPFILMHCELEGVIGSGGLSGKRQTYALLDERVPSLTRFDRDEALVELTRRYLTSHGPATAKDLSWWSGLTIADLKRALGDLSEEVGSSTVEGLTMWSIGSTDARRPSRGVHLLQTYDELVVGHAESRFLGDPGAERARVAWFDRNFPSGVFLLNGRIGGHWRRNAEPKRIRVEVVLYGRPTAADRKAVEAATHELGRFFDRPVELEIRLG